MNHMVGLSRGYMVNNGYSDASMTQITDDNLYKSGVIVEFYEFVY